MTGEWTNRVDGNRMKKNVLRHALGFCESDEEREEVKQAVENVMKVNMGGSSNLFDDIVLHRGLEEYSIRVILSRDYAIRVERHVQGMIDDSISIIIKVVPHWSFPDRIRQMIIKAICTYSIETYGDGLSVRRWLGNEDIMYPLLDRAAEVIAADSFFRLR